MATITIALNVLKELISFMAAQAKDEVTLIWNFKDDLQDMERTLAMLKAVLDDAAKRSDQDKVISLWLAELRDACYDIHDMLEPYLFQYRQLRRSKTVKVFFRKLHSRFRLAHKMKSIKTRLNKIAERKNIFNLKENMGLDMLGLIKQRETFSASNGSVVLGREKEQSEIVDSILNNINTSSDELFVIPIFGIGGLGKTTLAKLIFNDRRLRDMKIFNAWAWAYVSVGFDLQNIRRSMITSLRSSECRSMITCLRSSECTLQSLEMTSNELKNEVSGKRCLIVLDDVWFIDMTNGRI